MHVYIIIIIIITRCTHIIIMYAYINCSAVKTKSNQTDCRKSPRKRLNAQIVMDVFFFMPRTNITTQEAYVVLVQYKICAPIVLMSCTLHGYVKDHTLYRRYLQDEINNNIRSAVPSMTTAIIRLTRSTSVNINRAGTGQQKDVTLNKRCAV